MGEFSDATWGPVPRENSVAHQMSITDDTNNTSGIVTIDCSVSKYQNQDEFPIPKAFAGSQDVSTKIPHSYEFAAQHVVPPLMTGISWLLTLSAWLRAVCCVQPNGPYKKSPPTCENCKSLKATLAPILNEAACFIGRFAPRMDWFLLSDRAPARSNWEGEHPLPCGRWKCLTFNMVTSNHCKPSQDINLRVQLETRFRKG